jgi:hypothetical protein
MFLQKGYHATSVQDFTDAAGVLKGTFALRSIHAPMAGWLALSSGAEL